MTTGRNVVLISGKRRINEDADFSFRELVILLSIFHGNGRMSCLYCTSNGVPLIWLDRFCSGKIVFFSYQFFSSVYRAFAHFEARLCHSKSITVRTWKHIPSIRCRSPKIKEQLG